MLDGYDPAAAAARIGGEVSEVREPRRGAGGATVATKLPGPEPAEESRREAPPRRHESQREREREMGRGADGERGKGNCGQALSARGLMEEDSALPRPARGTRRREERFRNRAREKGSRGSWLPRWFFRCWNSRAMPHWQVGP